MGDVKVIFNIGDIVKHKLNGIRMIVLVNRDEDIGFRRGGDTVRVRYFNEATGVYETAYFYPEELKICKKKEESFL